MLFKKAFHKVQTESIINGFRKCGLFPFNPDAVDYNKCIPTRVIELQQPEELLYSLNSNDYLVCKNVINYILRDYDNEDVMSNNPILANILIECNDKSENNTICDSTTVAFNILEMPIEIEGLPFTFTEN